MAVHDALSWPPPATPARPGGARKKWMIVSLAAVVVLGLGIGIVAWAPWHQVPVAPAAVRAQSPTATSVLVSWPRSKGGATIDRYLIMRDGAQVGSVPASQMSFTDTGLPPGTSHRYAIVAASGTRRSSPSVRAVVTTMAPSPVGLTEGQVTWTTAVFRWSPSPKGPVPDTYTIYKGQAAVAVVPGTTGSYSITGLTPGTPYQYQVTATWGRHESARSAVLSVITLAPPLDGDVPVQVKTVSTPGGGASLSVGQEWSDTWSFTPDCSATRCTLSADAQLAAPGFSIQPFTMTLTGSGGGYAGSATAKITKCRSADVQNTVTLRITPDKGAVDNGGWNAWSGTMVLTSPYITADSGFYCPQQSWNFSVTGARA